MMKSKTVCPVFYCCEISYFEKRTCIINVKKGLGNYLGLTVVKSEKFRISHNEELSHLCRSPGIIMVVKSRSFELAGHVAKMKEMRNAYRILVGKHHGNNCLED
jgi:hypothetical protein